MFLPGVPCAPCCNPCQPPCPNLNAACLEVTFSGFSHGTGNCNECDFLDDGTYILERQGTGEFKLTGSIQASKGSGATVDVKVTKNQEDDSYTISSVSLTAAGSGYTQDARFVYTLSNGIVDCAGQPQVDVVVGVVPPVLTAAVSGGSGASLTVSVTPVNETEGEETWGIDEIKVASPGSGYTDGASVTITDSKATTVAAASATINVVRNQPSFYSFINGSLGGFAEISLQFTEEQIEGKDWYTVTGATILYQYGEFAVGDTATLSLPSGIVTKDDIQAVVEVSAVTQEDAIDSLTVDTEGSYYTTNGAIDSITVSNAGEYYRAGGIKSVSLVNGGKFWPNTPCVYSWSDCAVCPENLGSKVRVAFTAGANAHSIAVSRGFETIAEATKSHDGSEWDEEGFTFEESDFSEQYRCLNTGSVTVKVADCTEESETYCDLPESISLDISGIGDVFTWSSQNSGAPGLAFCDTNGDGVIDETDLDAPAESGYWGNIFCGQCASPQDGVRIQTGGVSAGPAGYSVTMAHRNETAILDRTPNICGIEYTGQLSGLPFATGSVVNGLVSVHCSEDQPRFISVQINPAGLETTVSIAGPTNEGEAATLEATAVNSTGGLTAITVLTPGSGYAREIFDRVAPTVTAESVSTGGTDAVLAVTLQQYGSGEQAVWSVDSVTVTSGGTGYTGQESLVFSVAEGDTAEWGAYGVIVTGREEPTISASVSSGTDAELEVVLTQTVDYEGNDVWEVSSVTVSDGGTGYDDGENVTFTVDDGVEVFSASATIVVGREEPAVTAGVSSAGGSGAVLSVTLQAGFSNDWSVDDVTITDGGVDYEEYDTITFSTSDTEQYGASAYVSSVDQDGAITGISLLDGGSYYKSTGVIESVTLGYGGGQYYKSTGSIESVTIYDGGAYYRLESTGTADVDEPAVSIGSNIGFGATATATVDGTVGSATFGQVLSISIDAAGENYHLGGTGWKATIFAELTHRAGECLVSPAAFVGDCAGENESCPGFSAYALPMAQRVTADPCPTALLSRTYSMAFERLTRFYGDIANADDATYCFSGYYGNRLVIVDFGQGDIECTIAPA